MAEAEIGVRADPFWGRECLAYNLQGRLPEGAVGVLGRWQAGLARDVACPVHLVPAHALHFTVFAPVPFSWPDAEKEPFWQSVKPRLLELLPELGRACRELELEFTSTRMFPGAVVAVARDPSGAIGWVRERLSEICRHPTLSSPSYDLLHCTLGRFRADGIVSVAEQRACAVRWQPFAARPHALALVRELRYPSLEVEDLVVCAL